jgi:hypothetical protein
VERVESMVDAFVRAEGEPDVPIPPGPPDKEAIER